MSDYVTMLWVIGLASQVTLFVVLLGTRRHRRFPLLVLTLAWEVFSASALRALVPYSTSHLQFVTYWVLNLVDIVLQLALFRQLGRESRSHDDSWQRRIDRLLNVVSGGGIVGVLVIFFILLPSANMDALALWDMRFELVTTMVSLVLFAAIMISANFGGIVWSRFAVALSQGLALIQITTTAADYSHLVRGWAYSDQWSDLLKLVVNTAVMVFWTISCLFPSRQRARSMEDPVEVPLRKRA